MEAAAQLALDYAREAFPNVALPLLRDFISKYPGQLFVAGCTLAATCITPLWEYIYDCLLVNDPNRIAITASYKRIPEYARAEDRARLEEEPPNGYTTADKDIINEILKKATDQRPKELLKIYDKKGTFDDAKAELKRLGDGSDGKEVDPNVWMKMLSNGKTVIVRKKSTDKMADATFEVKTTVKTINGKTLDLPIIKVRYYK